MGGVHRSLAALVSSVAILAGPLALLSSGAAAYPLVDVTLMTIEGVVADPVDRPIPGAAVTDGHQTVFTDASGHYALEEEALRDYSVSVSRTGFNAEKRWVIPTEALLDSVDFTLTYEVYFSMTPWSFSNATDTTIEITAETVSGTETTCILWTDEDSDTPVSLDLDESHTGERNRWTGSFVSPAARSAGEYPWNLTVTECESDTSLIAGEVYGTYTVTDGT